jgi:hypothetical protein
VTPDQLDEDILQAGRDKLISHQNQTAVGYDFGKLALGCGHIAHTDTQRRASIALGFFDLRYAA